jgi:hypothetical protein
MRYQPITDQQRQMVRLRGRRQNLEGERLALLMRVLLELNEFPSLVLPDPHQPLGPAPPPTPKAKLDPVSKLKRQAIPMPKADAQRLLDEPNALPS